MPAPSSLRSGASFQCQACKIKDLTEHALIKHSSRHHMKDRILVPALGIEGALVGGKLQCPRCPELSCTPLVWDDHVNVNHEFEVGELPTCLVRPLFDRKWHQDHQEPPSAISRDTRPPLQRHQCQAQKQVQKCNYDLGEGDNEGPMMLHFALSHEKHEIVVPEHGDIGDLVQWYIPCPFYPTCPVIFSTFYAWNQHRSITYPGNSSISPAKQLIRARLSRTPCCHQSKPTSPPESTNNFMAAKAGPHPHHSCGQAPHSHSVSHNSQYQQPPSHTKHTQHLSDTSSAEDHQQHSGRPILSKHNPHIRPFTQHPSDISSAEHDQQHSGRPVLSKDNPHIPPFTHTPQTSAGIASPQCPNLH